MQLTGCELPQLESLTRELKVLRDQLVANVKANAATATAPSVLSPTAEYTAGS